jgi:murein endopeptidase
MQPPRPRSAARHLLIVVLAALLLSPGTPHPDPSPNSPDRNLYPGASDRDPYPGAPHSDLSPGAPHRDPSGTGAPTGRVARPEERVLAAVHSGAGASGAEAGIEWRRSRAVGRPNHGRLVGGVKLPAAGANFVTVDPVAETSPNRAWRRYGSDRLVRVLLRVAREHAAAHPGAARLVVGDLSRPHGGRFGPEYGGDGHRSHQNGLDADVYYPRRDGLERIPRRVGQVDRRLAQELVDRFVRAGAQYVFVGPRTGLRGPAKVVMTLANHDDHLHVRIRPGPGARR